MSDDGKTMSRDKYLKLPLSGRFAALLKFPYTDYFPKVDRDHDYEERTATAVAKTREWILKECENKEAKRVANQDESEEDEDSDNSRPVNMGPGGPTKPPAAEKAEYYSYFIGALPSCDTLNVGFDINPETRAW